MTAFRIGIPVVAMAVVLAACGTTATPTPSGSAASAAPSGGGEACTTAPAGTTADAMVTIRDFKFDPPSVTIRAGGSVAWTNQDSASHTATTLDGACDTQPIAKGQTVTLTFPAAGTYTYHCKIHASMPEATVEVTP